MRRALVVACLALACGPRARHLPAGRATATPGVHVTLYRDHAVVAHRLEVTIPAASTTTVRFRVAAGVAADGIYLIEKSDVVVRGARTTTLDSGPPTTAGCDEVSCVLDNYERACCAKFERNSEWEDAKPAAVESPSGPTEVEVTVGAPREGKFSILIGYDTERIAWDAAYTMTTTHAHDRAQLRGALAIRNATGLDLRDVHVLVVDGRHGTASQRAAAQIGIERAGADPNSTPIAVPRDVGRVDLAIGETRVELLAHPVSRPLRSVLVFDPIGTGLDYPHSAPVQDPNLGVVPPPSTRVTESLEIDRAADTSHLPAGPVRVLERQPDGAVVLLGESTLFGVATLAAARDTVAIGTAERVTGKRERRELTVDNDRKRVVEEVAVTIDNKRERPVDVVLREHLYRGENWTIAYDSAIATKEGKQQIAMRIAVPPKQKQTVLYVVVYSWSP